MEQLKTLKDLQKDHEWAFDTYQALRQEAIKHIKRIGMVSGKTKNKFKRYQLIGQMVWIKDFFNITGEDLNEKNRNENM